MVNNVIQRPAAGARHFCYFETGCGRCAVDPDQHCTLSRKSYIGAAFPAGNPREFVSRPDGDRDGKNFGTSLVSDMDSVHRPDFTNEHGPSSSTKNIAATVIKGRRLRRTPGRRSAKRVADCSLPISTAITRRRSTSPMNALDARCRNHFKSAISSPGDRDHVN